MERLQSGRFLFSGISVHLKPAPGGWRGTGSPAGGAFPGAGNSRTLCEPAVRMRLRSMPHDK